MKKWFLGVLSGIFLCFALLFFIGWFGMRMQSRPPQVSPNTILILELSGNIPEQVPPDLAGQLLGEPERITFLSLLRDIEKASSDNRIRGILLKPSNLELGWAKLQHLRRALQRFQDRGKRVAAALEVAGTREYYLASVASQVYLSPAGLLDIKGMRAEVMLFKDGLTKLGIQADLEQIGKYKNMADQFTTNRMSDAFREATTSMLDSIYSHFLQTVAEARRQPLEQMRETIEQGGPFESQRALLAGLVDQLLYQDQVWKQLESESPGESFHKMDMKDYRRVAARTPPLGGGQRIAVIYAVGAIVPGEDQTDPLAGGKTLGADTMAEVLESVEKDDSIKGAVVRIDSPGGDAFASDNIWRRMTLLREKKPLVFSMSDTAASGGYYIAMTGDPIVAEPGTLTGSIGIVYGKLNLKGFYDKLGINKEIISRGRFSRLDSDYGPYTPEERQRVREIMENFYQGFLDKVAAARKMTPEDVDRIAQGRVWTGEQAAGNGLVDEIGDFSRALELVKEKAGIAAEEPVQLVEFPRRKSLWELLLRRAEGGGLRLPAPISRWLAEWTQLESLAQRPLWAVLPVTFEFR